MKKIIVAAFFALSLAVSGRLSFHQAYVMQKFIMPMGMRTIQYGRQGVTMAALTIYRHASSIMRTMTT